MRLIDADAVKLPKGFFEEVDNVPKFYEWLNKLPPIEPKRGKWIKRKDAMGKDIYICSNCETEVLWRDMRGVLLRVDMQNAPFCPNCGARMEGSEE